MLRTLLRNRQNNVDTHSYNQLDCVCAFSVTRETTNKLTLCSGAFSTMFSLQVRINLTRDELQHIKIAAIRNDLSTPKFIAMVLRDYLTLGETEADERGSDQN